METYKQRYCALDIDYPGAIKIYQANNGSNLLATILDGCNIYYKSGYKIIQDKKVAIDKEQFITNIRNDLAIKLDTSVDKEHKKYFSDDHFTTVDGRDIDPTYFDVLYYDKEKYKLEDMQDILKSDIPLDMYFINYISLIFNCDIYIIETKNYFLMHKTSYNFNSSIVLLFNQQNNHYNLVAIQNKNKFLVDFKLNHPFIQYILNKFKTNNITPI